MLAADHFQPGYILHSKPWRDSSLLVDLFTQNFGRKTVIVKGARQVKKGRARWVLQPFTPLLFSWVGRCDLKILTDVEPSQSLVSLQWVFLPMQ